MSCCFDTQSESSCQSNKNNENRPNLDTQADRLVSYCAAKGWQVSQIVKEIGSGINDNRQKLLKLLRDKTVTIIVVEHKDRLTRFGFNYIETLLVLQGRKIEVVNLADNGKEDLLSDLVSIIYSFCARLYGLRRAKRQTEKITAALKVERAVAQGFTAKPKSLPRLKENNGCD